MISLETELPTQSWWTLAATCETAQSVTPRGSWDSGPGSWDWEGCGRVPVTPALRRGLRWEGWGRGSVAFVLLCHREPVGGATVRWSHPGLLGGSGLAGTALSVRGLLSTHCVPGAVPRLPVPRPTQPRGALGRPTVSTPALEEEPWRAHRKLSRPAGEHCLTLGAPLATLDSHCCQSRGAAGKAPSCSQGPTPPGGQTDDSGG